MLSIIRRQLRCPPSHRRLSPSLIASYPVPALSNTILTIDTTKLASTDSSLGSRLRQALEQNSSSSSPLDADNTSPQPSSSFSLSRDDATVSRRIRIKRGVATVPSSSTVQQQSKHEESLKKWKAAQKAKKRERLRLYQEAEAEKRQAAQEARRAAGEDVSIVEEGQMKNAAILERAAVQEAQQGAVQEALGKPPAGPLHLPTSHSRIQRMGQEVRTALDSPALNAEAKAKLKEEWVSFKAVREFHRPWDSLSYKHQHTEADLLKKQLMKAELKKRRDQGQAIDYTIDNHPLLSVFHVSPPSRRRKASTADVTVVDAAAGRKPVGEGRGKHDTTSELAVRKQLLQKVKALAREHWPQRLVEIAQQVAVHSSNIGRAVRKVQRNPSGHAPLPRMRQRLNEQEAVAPSNLLGDILPKSRPQGEAASPTPPVSRDGEFSFPEETTAAPAPAPWSNFKLRSLTASKRPSPPTTSTASPPIASPPSPQPHRYADHPAIKGHETLEEPPHLSPSPSEPPRELSSYTYTLSSSSTPFVSHPPPLGPVPVATLSHSLDRALFNPGVHFLRDPRTGVYNFDPETLENVPKVSEFAFDKLPQYVTSSKDEVLKGIAESEGRTFVGSTSSTVGMLCQIYFWLSKGKEVNLDMLSGEFREMNKGFSFGQSLPVSVVLNYRDGKYAIDADKSFDPGSGSNVLSEYGHLMEKLLTTDAKEFKRFLADSDDPAPSQADEKQAYHYAMTDHLVLRSQLDASNEHLPNMTFDLKTRGTVAIRQDRLNYEESAGYTIDRLRGPWESFEREYYDLVRSAFLKYSLQARIGHMDGVLVAYHSTARFFGFQYLPISEMDEALHGNSATGDQAFGLSLGVLEKLLIEAAACYPEQSVNVTWAADVEADVLRLFVTPQRAVEELQEAKAENGKGGSESVDTPSSTTKTALDKLPMTLLEVRGRNYLDGEEQSGPVTLHSRPSRDASGRYHPSKPHTPTWELGFDIVKSTGNDELDVAPDFDSHFPSLSSSSSSPHPAPVSVAKIASLFSTTRSLQLTFSSIALPTGVSVADVHAAAERAKAAGVELDESDLSVRFPIVEGLEYRGPGYMVRGLRERAREGTRRMRRREEEERVSRGKGGGNKRVQVVSRVEVVDVVEE